MNTLFSHSKIIFGLIISYIIVTTFSSVFFIGDSPTLRPHPEQYLALKFNRNVSTLVAGLGLKKKVGVTTDEYNKFMNSAVANSLKQVAPATYAADINGQSVEIFKPGELPIVEHTFVVDGKQIKITTDASSEKLSQQEVEQMMREFGAVDPSTR